MAKTQNKGTGKGSGRARPWTVVFYGLEAELCAILREYSERIAHFAYILHDRDVYAEDLIDEKTKDVIHKKGEIEKVHFHVLLDFYNGHTFTAVKRLFTTANNNPRVEKIIDRVAQYRYLTHKDDPDKYQYDDDEIYSNDINYYEKLCVVGDRVEVDNKAEQIVNDILRGVSPRLLVSRYGRDYVIHMRQYKDCADEIRLWEMENRRREREKAEILALKEKEVEQLRCPFDE